MKPVGDFPPKGDIPVPQVDRWLVPVRQFLRIEATSGVVLIGCTTIALVLANSPWSAEFASVWKTSISFTIGAFSIAGDVGHLLVNDVLMTIFFFVVGLEVKREIVSGELRNPRNALLPLFGAAGGVLVPAAIYLALQWGQPGQRGWAIPMATDIAFVVGIVSLFGKRVPFGLRIFLLSLAIVDDLVAVLLIAVVFTESLSWGWMLAGASGFVVTAILNRIGVRAISAYAVVGVLTWMAFLKSGVHPTVEGVLMGLMTPARPWLAPRTMFEVVAEKFRWMRDNESDLTALPENLERLRFAARESLSPLHRLEQGLHLWVAYLIMPIFAMANAGVRLELGAITHPVSVAVAVSLTIGKPVGILLFTGAAIRLGLAALPEGVSWRVFAGGACLAGIGFTMALFLNALSFPPGEFASMESAGKVGVLAGSLLSAAIGSLLLWREPSRTE